MPIAGTAVLAVRLPSKDTRNRLVALAHFKGKSVNQFVLDFIEPLIKESQKLTLTDELEGDESGEP